MFKLIASLSRLQEHFEVSREHKCYGDALHHILIGLYGKHYFDKHFSIKKDDIVANYLGIQPGTPVKDFGEYLQLIYTYNWFFNNPHYFDHPILKEGEPYGEEVSFSQKGFHIKPNILKNRTSNRQYILTYDISYDSKQTTHSIAVFQDANKIYVYNRGVKVLGLLKLLDTYCNGGIPDPLQRALLKECDNTKGVLSPIDTIISFVDLYFKNSISLDEFKGLCIGLRQDINDNVNTLHEYVPNLTSYLESIIISDYEDLFPEKQTIPVTLFVHPYNTPETTQGSLLCLSN